MLIEGLGEESAPSCLAVADACSCPRLRRRALAFICDPQRFPAVVRRPAFTDLDKRIILEVLQNHNKVRFDNSNVDGVHNNHAGWFLMYAISNVN